jgi:hypothetical protein
VRREDVAPGNEGIGPLASDEVHAMYRLADGGLHAGNVLALKDLIAAVEEDRQNPLAMLA